MVRRQDDLAAWHRWQQLHVGEDSGGFLRVFFVVIATPMMQNYVHPGTLCWCPLLPGACGEVSLRQILYLWQHEWPASQQRIVAIQLP